eukprot:2945747-Alexandrium_andersonii.AAC.1
MPAVRAAGLRALRRLPLLHLELQRLQLLVVAGGARRRGAGGRSGLLLLRLLVLAALARRLLPLLVLALLEGKLRLLSRDIKLLRGVALANRSALGRHVCQRNQQACTPHTSTHARAHAHTRAHCAAEEGLIGGSG